MTPTTLATPGGGIGASPLRTGWTRAMSGSTGPVLTIVLALVILWYVAAIVLNAPLMLSLWERRGVDWTYAQLIAETMNHRRPVLPTPHQVVVELWNTMVGEAPTSKRSLLYHAWITFSSTLLGFVFGTGLGILIAVGIVHSRTLDKSLMPWIIASQTIPILAVAPMVVVVLGAIGLTGLVPKALISAYLSFFPVAVGMVKGLRSPDLMHLDLMRTYSASQTQTFAKLRWPAALPYLFPAMQIGVAISLVGAIVGEMPTGAVAGLGARLLSGSYYGQTVQIWAALITASVLAATLVVAIGWLGRRVAARSGA